MQRLCHRGPDPHASALPHHYRPASWVAWRRETWLCPAQGAGGRGFGQRAVPSRTIPVLQLSLTPLPGARTCSDTAPGFSAWGYRASRNSGHRKGQHAAEGHHHHWPLLSSLRSVQQSQGSLHAGSLHVWLPPALMAPWPGQIESVGSMSPVMSAGPGAWPLPWQGALPELVGLPWHSSTLDASTCMAPSMPCPQTLPRRGEDTYSVRLTGSACLQMRLLNFWTPSSLGVQPGTAMVWELLLLMTWRAVTIRPLFLPGLPGPTSWLQSAGGGCSLRGSCRPAFPVRD